jgi:hypothetical protein
VVRADDGEAGWEGLWRLRPSADNGEYLEGAAGEVTCCAKRKASSLEDTPKVS